MIKVRHFFLLLGRRNYATVGFNARVCVCIYMILIQHGGVVVSEVTKSNFMLVNE